MADKVAIQISVDEGKALVPIHTPAAVAAWDLAYNSDGTVLLTMTPASKFVMVQNLWWVLAGLTVASLWTGFYIGRRDRRRKAG